VYLGEFLVNEASFSKMAMGNVGLEDLIVKVSAKQRGLQVKRLVNKCNQQQQKKPQS
jgi:hypothetical protein